MRTEGSIAGIALVACALLVVAAAAGCADEEIHFDGPSLADYHAAAARFEAPTGTYDATTARWIADQAAVFWPLVQAFEDLTAVYPQFFGGGAAEFAPGTNADTSGADTTTATGTLRAALTAGGYLRYSCPGPDPGTPDLEFGHGEARMESDAIDLQGVDVGDEMRFGLLFTDCRVSDTTLRGLAWGLLGGGLDGVLLLLDLTTEALDTPAAHLSADTLWTAEGLSVLLTHPESGTFRLSLDAGADVLGAHLAAANGLWSCTIDPATRGLDCDPAP